MLPRVERDHLLSVGEPVDLVFDDVLFRAGAPLRHAYFPVESFVSLLTTLGNKPVLEVGMAGCEGMVGAQLALGIARTSLHARVQGAGKAWRVGADDFRKALKVSPRLQETLHHYLYVLMAQQTSSAACLRFHHVTPRLARWLLMSQDRAGSDQFHITHEFIALMLGVRRVGITEAASDLQRRGLIEYKRGELTVLNRDGLEANACECYANDLRIYRSIIG